MKKNVDDFIKEHTYINYCECCVDPEGNIEYARPSHVEYLLKVGMNQLGKTRDEVYAMIPIWASPMIWLVDFLGYITVYSNGYILPQSLSEAQNDALEKLIKQGLTRRNNHRSHFN